MSITHLCRLVENADVVTKLKRRSEHDDERHKYEVDVETLASQIIHKHVHQFEYLSRSVSVHTTQ